MSFCIFHFFLLSRKAGFEHAIHAPLPCPHRQLTLTTCRQAKTIFFGNLGASVASKKCPAALSSTLVTGATMTFGYLVDFVGKVKGGVHGMPGP